MYGVRGEDHVCAREKSGALAECEHLPFTIGIGEETDVQQIAHLVHGRGRRIHASQYQWCVPLTRENPIHQSLITVHHHSIRVPRVGAKETFLVFDVADDGFRPAEVTGRIIR